MRHNRPIEHDGLIPFKLRNVGVVLLMATLLLPVAVVVVQSFSAGSAPNQGLALYAIFFRDSVWRGALFRSCGTSALAAGIAAVLSSLAVMEIKSKPSFEKLHATVLALVSLPILIPAIVLAVGLLELSNALRLGQPFLMRFAVQIALAMPFVLTCSLVATRNISSDVLEAALLSGANRLRVFLCILLPLASRGLLAGVVLAFLYCFDELVIAQFLSDPRALPVSVKLWSGLRFNFDPFIYVVGTLTVITFCTIIPLLLWPITKYQRDRKSVV